MELAATSLMHPLIANIGFTVAGWGPALTIFWWSRGVLSSGVDWSWRFVSVGIGRLEVSVQWI